jgi:hypothetical protein
MLFLYAFYLGKTSLWLLELSIALNVDPSSDLKRYMTFIPLTFVKNFNFQNIFFFF